MRNKGAFERTGEISREATKKSDWLEGFAEKLALEEATAETRVKVAKTAVEVARHRQQNQPSIYEMMSSIISGNKPKHSSVEEAVIDYQNRTGLTQYLKVQSEDNIKDLAFQVAQAAEECESDDENELDAEEMLEVPEPEEMSADDEEADEPEEGGALAEIIELFKSDGGEPVGAEETLFGVPEIDEPEDAASADCGDAGKNPFVMAGLMENELFSSADEVSKKKMKMKRW